MIVISSITAGVVLDIDLFVDEYAKGNKGGVFILALTPVLIIGLGIIYNGILFYEKKHSWNRVKRIFVYLQMLVLVLFCVIYTWGLIRIVD